MFRGATVFGTGTVLRRRRLQQGGGEVGDLIFSAGAGVGDTLYLKFYIYMLYGY